MTEARGTSGPRRRQSFLSHLRHNPVLYALLLPGLAYFLLFKYLPMYGVVIAFKRYNMFSGIFASEWVGLKNFRLLFQSDYFYRILRNSILISLYKLVLTFPAPILIAVLLNEIRGVLFKRVVQTVIYFPYFLSWVIVAGFIVNLLSPTSGVVNLIIRSLGGRPVHFLISRSWFRPIIVLSDMWKFMGWHSIIYLAAIASIDPQLYEAATIDGAGRLAKMRFVTLPSIRSTIVVMLLLRVGHMMDNSLEQIFLLYNPMVYEVGDVIETYVYRIGLVESRYDFSTAVGLFKSLVGLILLVLANTVARRVGERGIY